MRERVVFTEEMRRDYTILIPTMLPMHFKMIAQTLCSFGYKAEVLENSGQRVIDNGLKYVHNDACYPSLLIIGQFIDALNSGKYDPHKVALLYAQTGGGCRASNYISLLRKALEKAGYEYVPVISLNLTGLEDNPGFKLTLPLLHRMVYAVMYGDLLMLLRNQCMPYEKVKGTTEKKCEEWTERLVAEMADSRINYRHIKANYARIVRDFDAIPKTNIKKIKVGIVGEIFVKFSPLGNNNLEQFLVDEGAEVYMAGLVDFCLYCVQNGLVDRELYGGKFFKSIVSRAAKRIVVKKQNDLIDAIKKNSNFTPPTPFDHTFSLIKGYIGAGTKMGEGWLLPAEMLELIDSGFKNIICVQPFGCLPNHIVGKGMMKPIKERNPGVNIVAVDYDPGATKINQENRIKLMLSCARDDMENSVELSENDEKVKEPVLV